MQWWNTMSIHMLFVLPSIISHDNNLTKGSTLIKFFFKKISSNDVKMVNFLNIYLRTKKKVCVCFFFLINKMEGVYFNSLWIWWRFCHNIIHMKISHIHLLVYCSYKIYNSWKFSWIGFPRKLTVLLFYFFSEVNSHVGAISMWIVESD